MYNNIDYNCCKNMHGYGHRYGRRIGFPQGLVNFDIVPAETAVKFKPRTDISEDKSAFSFAFELPGVSKDDIKVQVDDSNVLTVEAEKKAPENLEFVRRERFFGSFRRSFELPKDADNKSVNAKFEDGILMVTVKKIVPSEKVVEIK